MKLHMISRLAFLVLLAIVFVFPLYWMITGSFKAPVSIWATPPEWFPPRIKMLNYDYIFSTTPAIRWLFNSIFTSLTTVLFVVLFSAMAGYAYAKRKFPGSKILFFIVIATMMMPTQVTLVPLYMICKDLHLIDSYLGIILPTIAFPFGVFIVRQFAKTVPDEIVESAKMDGAGEIRIFVSIMVPFLLPALGALSIFAFMHTWNDYLWQLIILHSKEKLTLPLGISTISHSENNVNYGYAMAGATLAAVPMILFFLLLQRSFIKGIALGSIKG